MDWPIDAMTLYRLSRPSICSERASLNDARLSLQKPKQPEPSFQLQKRQKYSGHQIKHPHFKMTKADQWQTIPSFYILDELASSNVSITSINRHSAHARLPRLKTPAWNKNQDHSSVSSPGRINPPRSRRSQSGSGKKPNRKHPGSTGTFDGALDDDISPTSSAPASPRVDSPYSIVPKQVQLSKEEVLGKDISSMTKATSMLSTGIPLVGQTIGPARRENSQDQHGIGKHS